MNEDLKKIYKSSFLPFVLIVVMTIIKLIEYFTENNFVEFGIYPRHISSLKGVLFSPFLHSDFHHLLSNIFAFLFLLSSVFYFYRKNSFLILWSSFLFTGLILWIIGRSNFHIGASGLVYCYATFLFLSGIFNRNTQLSALSLVVIFLYGGLFWGIFPFKWNLIYSWEGHLSGTIVGVVLAVFLRNEGPKRKKYQWEIEEELYGEPDDQLPFD